MASSEQDTYYDTITPTQARGLGSQHASRRSEDLSSTIITRPYAKEGRSLSGSTHHYGPKGSFMGGASAIPGAFNTDLKSNIIGRAGTPRPDTAMSRMQSAQSIHDDESASEQRLAAFKEKIAKEMKIKLGTENMLEALLAKSSKQTKDQRQKVEAELGSSNRKIAELKLLLEQEIQRAISPSTPPNKRMTSYFRGSPLKSNSTNDIHNVEEPESTPFEGESPTIVLTETLQALEVEGMTPDYYIERANTLVELFKLNPTLKYDLAWSVFSLRVQVMLLSDSTDVVAAGYRLTRYAIADRASLQTIRKLHTDELVILSLVKKTKAVLEREQAVKFVRAFMDVPDGAREISRAVCRTLVAVAEHHEDRLKNICVLTLAEILMKHPSLLISANGISTLSDAMAEGTFPASESLVVSFLHILDVPRRRQYLKSGREFEAMFAPFTDPLLLGGNEERLKICAKAISAMLKTWPGFMTLSMRNAAPLRSLLDSLQYPIPQSRDLVLELLFDVLRIKPPSWSNTFLAGRRLTTYGRVTNLAAEPTSRRILQDGEGSGQNLDLISHFISIVLATLIKVGLIPALSKLIIGEEDPALKRKATLLLTEVLKLAGQSLPISISANLQVLGDLVSPLSDMEEEDHSLNTSLVYQIASINRTVGRSGGKQIIHTELLVGTQASERSKYSAGMDGEQFRLAMLETGVPNHTQYLKWKWDLIHSLIEGPLTNIKRLEEAIKGTKFLKRIVGFYRPFKYRFCMIRNTRPNQRYVRTGCALIKSLASTSLGIQYLVENKLLRQIAECLAQVDRHSGLTSATPLFDRHQMAETLSGGYFAMIGALSHTVEGLHMMERWHMMNMFYHIIDLRDRDDLVRALLCNMDFSIDSHLRVMLSRSLTIASKDIRLLSTRLLRPYALGMESNHYNTPMTSSQWALRLLLTQLYDPEIEVCEVAIKILEEACNQRSHLEYVVKCRPSLDHLGEIGAPLLLRFLSTSVGYHYLNGLDYITQEMDDWFLGRNDLYVALVEASLARAYIDQSASKGGTFADDTVDVFDTGVQLPPHFYRELARTQEGCKLLRQSGHFYEFTSMIHDFDLAEEEYENLTKIKGCLWAVGNVGSMELGAAFLEESEIVPAIIRIAEGADVISMRGTAFFVLGLISRSTHGFEMLLEQDWNSVTDARGQSLGLCMPRDLGRLCAMPFRPTQPDPKLTAEQAEAYRQAVDDPVPLNAKILRLIVDMGNSVMYKKAAGNLHAIKQKHGDAFKQVGLFERTLTILESHHFRLLARQFILDLFDKAVLRRVVLEDDTEEEEEEVNEESAGSDTN